MERYDLTTNAAGRPAVHVARRGERLLNHPMYNKGSAFSREERATLGLEGLLPDVVTPMEVQAHRIHGHISRKTDPLEKYIGLAALQDRNEHLYYRVLLDNLHDYLPIVYTPTVGKASQSYSHIFRRGRGIFITPRHRGRIAQVLRNSPFADVRLIVATDNSAILGLGDQGAGGMVIPIGKLAIYCAAAGIHPTRTLPVSLDVGTNRQELLDDELYMGWREKRLTGDEYTAMVDEFVEAVKEVFPRALLQWEDFSKRNAYEVLERHRSRIASFNDDIQGTGATALAGILAADRITGRHFSDHRVVILGAGAAGKGIALQLRAVMRESGIADADLLHRIALLDSGGLLCHRRGDLEAYKRELAWEGEYADGCSLPVGADLLSVVRAVRPSVLIGTSGVPGCFDEVTIQAMAEHEERPIVMPFSNPTDQSEAVPEDLLRWTNGGALVATGSPFPPVEYGGKTIEIGQGNNALIFPGVGLGVLVAEAHEVTQGMFTAAARALADCVGESSLESQRLYPRIRRLREVTRRVAEAVVRQAREEGRGRELADSEIEGTVASAMWEPDYPELTLE